MIKWIILIVIAILAVRAIMNRGKKAAGPTSTGTAGNPRISVFSMTSDPYSYVVSNNDTCFSTMPSREEVYLLNYGGMKFTPFNNYSYFIQFTFDNNDDYGVLIYSDYIEDGPYLLLGINEGDQLGQICVYVKYTSESGLGEALTYIQPNQTANESSKQRMYHWISQNAVD